MDHDIVEAKAKARVAAARIGHTASARSQVEAAFELIRREILSGALPPRSKLRFGMLSARYGFGVGTLREALTRLVGEALVTFEEQRGFRVVAISLADFTDITRTRILLENEAMRKSILKGDDAWEGRVVAAYHRLAKIEARLASVAPAPEDEFEARNRDFHQALISACPSPWLTRLHGILFQQSERYRRIALANLTPARDVHAEHRAIFEAAMARDADRACDYASEHIERTLIAISQLMGFTVPAP